MSLYYNFKILFVILRCILLILSKNTINVIDFIVNVIKYIYEFTINTYKNNGKQKSSIKHNTKQKDRPISIYLN